MGRVCIKACCFVGNLLHIIWAAALLALTGVLQSDVVTQNIGFVPTTYDLIFLWLYDIGLLLTGIAIFCGLVWKKQRLLSWMILIFLVVQSLAFAVVVVMLTMDRFSHTKFGPMVEKTLHASPNLLISIIAGFHCIGSFIYIILLVLCIHKLNEKFSPYWK